MILRFDNRICMVFPIYYYHTTHTIGIVVVIQ